MKLFQIFLLLVGIAACTNAQKIQPQVSVDNNAFDEELKSLLSFSVPLITVDELDERLEEVTLLDAREIAEYDVSHIKGALCIGYDSWDKKLAKQLDRSKPIVVYCSVGYRSEKIGERLEKMGFEQVYNLYGSIFEWVNSGKAVVDASGKATDEVHTYNKKWSQWVFNSNAQKVY